MNFGTKGDLWFLKGGPKILLAEAKGFLTLSASVQGNDNRAASLHAVFTNKNQRLSMKERHNTLEHTEPAAIKHLKKRGLSK